MNITEVWENVLMEIELSVSPATFNTWFKNTCLIKYEDCTALLGVPNEFVKQWIESKHHKIIMRLLRERVEGVRTIEYTIFSNTQSYPQNITSGDEIKTGTDNTSEKLPLQDHYVSKEDNLNPRYIFSNFVIGSFNELAYAASQAVIKNPGISYNPLFIYGKTGHGKTHLIQAVGNSLKAKKGGVRVYYITSEQFGTEFVDALQNNRVNNFKDKYRNYDVFVMDDTQFFSRKEKIQEELFHLFNTYHDKNKQIIFSSDTHPGRLPDIDARIISRFSAGMVVEITEPDFESRINILKTKAKNSSMVLTDEVVEFLAESVADNIRDLEGALNTIICQAELQNREATILDVKKFIKEYARPKKKMSAQEVVSTISSFYGIEEPMIYEKTRKKEVVKPRQIIMYILREDFGASYPTIGQRLGGRDHTTVIHSCEKIKEEVKNNQELSQELNQIRSMLK